MIKQCLWCIRLPSGASPRILTPLQSSANMGRCSYESCTSRPTFSCKGKKAAYCRQHAPDSMIAVHHSRCSHDACTKQPVYNFEGSKTAVCCCKHAEDGMVDVRSKHCRYDSCYKMPSFNFKGRKSPVYCKQHADISMVNVCSQHCLQESCTKTPNFNVAGGVTAVFCKQHAEDGMVDVRCKRCAYDSCNTRPSFNYEGRKPAVYCKQHALGRMVNVLLPRRCSHISCSRCPVWGLATDCTARVCSYHRGDMMGGPVIHFKAKCKTFGCRKRSLWGPSGQQTTHCHKHGPLEDNLVCISATAGNKASCASPPCNAVLGPSFHIKLEASI